MTLTFDLLNLKSIPDQVQIWSLLCDLSRGKTQLQFFFICFNNNNNNNGPLNETACQFLKDLGRRISAQSGDERESAFLFQRLSVVNSAIRRYLAPQQFRGGRPPGLMVIPAFTFSNQFFFFALGIGDALGTKKIIIIIPLTTIFFDHTCCFGRPSSSTFLRSCLLNSLAWRVGRRASCRIIAKLIL